MFYKGNLNWTVYSILNLNGITCIVTAHIPFKTGVTRRVLQVKQE